MIIKKISFVMPFHILEQRGGGSEVQAWLLAKELALQGYDVSYIAQSVTGKDGITKNVDNVKIRWLRYFPKFWLSNCFSYYRCLRKTEPDLVVQRGSSSPITWAAGFYCRRHKVKFIWICSDNISPYKWKYLRSLIKKYKGSHKNIFKSAILKCNAFLLDVVRQRGMRYLSLALVQNKKQRILVKREFGLDSQKMISGHKVPEKVNNVDNSLSEGIVLWVGSLGPRKRPEKFIELALLNKNKDLRFIMIGSKEDKSYLERLFRNKPANLEWKGRLPFEETLYWFSRAAFFVNTSIEEGEGFPNTYIQAWLRGTPVFALEANPDDVINKEKLGYVNGNLSTLLNEIQSYMNHKHRYSDLSSRIQEYARTHHSLEILTDAFLKIISELENESSKAQINLSTSNRTKQINFGIMVKSPEIKAWELECINQSLSVGGGNLKLVILPENKDKKNEKKVHKSPRNRNTFKIFFNLYELYEKYFFNSFSNHRINCSNKFKDIPSIKCSVSKGADCSDSFLDKDIKNIKAAKLDFIILFSGFQNLKGEILNSSKYGIWSFFYSGIAELKSSLLCFWQVYKNNHTADVILCKLSTKKDRIFVIRQGCYKVTNYSHKKHYDYLHSQSQRLLNEACMDINNKCISFTEKEAFKNSNPINNIPSNIQFINYAIKMPRKKIVSIIKFLFTIDIWNIGIIRCTVDDFIKDNMSCRINWLLLPSKNEFFADPFLLDFDNTHYILFEHYDFKVGRGHICSLKLDEKNMRNEILPSQKKDIHLSYPLVFKYEGDIYLIIEEWRSHNISVYRAIDFPLKWKKQATLIDNVSAVDSTLFKSCDLWWLAFTKIEDDPRLRLHLYYSKSLFDGWEPHKRNPVKTDIRSSRSAGNVFEYHRELIRPSQDASEFYGTRIVLNKIVRLTPEEFEEVPIRILEPNPKYNFNKGMHTINFLNDLIVIDGKKRILSSKKFVNLMKRKIIGIKNQ